MSDLLLSEGATNKANEADHFAFLISDVVIPDGTPRLDVVASLADAGIYTTEDDLVYGKDESGRTALSVTQTIGTASRDHPARPTGRPNDGQRCRHAVRRCHMR